jgi:methylated-DNA-[protein]-cysteine S-methyltransferase
MRYSDGMTANDLGRATFDTAIGTCGIAWSARGVVHIQLPEASAEGTLARMARTVPDAVDAKPPLAVRAAIDAMTRHLRGDEADLASIDLDMSNVPRFYRQVYVASRTIPSGKTLSYGEIAAQIGAPNAARAVGQALGKNPFAIVVPCHRVLAAGRKAGGFSAHGGLATKARMLAIEGFELEPQDDLPIFRAAGKKLGYDADAALAHLSSRDKRLAALIARVGPFAMKLAEANTTFGVLAESIVYQQLTGKAAATIFGRVKAACVPFEPKRMLAVRDEKLRLAGLSRAKLAALKDLAKKSIDGTVPSLTEIAKMDDDAIVERLTQVRGIGRWTVEMLLIFRLGRPDVLPVGDYGVRKGFAQAYRKKELPTPKELAKHGEKWRPFRSVASWYLWRALDTEGGRA